MNTEINKYKYRKTLILAEKEQLDGLNVRAPIVKINSLIVSDYDYCLVKMNVGQNIRLSNE